MARYNATVQTRLAPAEVFDLLANFANAEEWDPATTASRQLGDDPIGIGARFELTMEIAGRANEIVYEIVEYELPHRVVLRGENGGSVSIDTITVTPGGSGSQVEYSAQVTMKGGYKLIGPLFVPVFKRMGDKARDRMGEWLDGVALRAS